MKVPMNANDYQKISALAPMSDCACSAEMIEERNKYSISRVSWRHVVTFMSQISRLAAVEVAMIP